MITAHYIEVRSRKLPGSPVVTIQREVTMRNGHGRKTLKVLRNGRTVSEVSEPLNTAEKSLIQKRKFKKGMFKKAQRKTLRRINRA